MSVETAVEAVKVHISGSDVPFSRPEPRRRRRGVALRTFTLTSNDPVQQILPLNSNRCEAWVQNVDTAAKDFTLHESLANAQAGIGVTVPKGNTGPYPLATTDAVWATAADADLPVTISVSAVMEAD